MITKKKAEVKKVEEKKLPVAKFNSGAIRCSIWCNEIEKDGEKFENYTFSIERTYKDGEDWKKTSSLRKRDIASVQAIMNKVSEYLLIDEDEEVSEE